jgi:hypothetical protein
MSSLLTRRSAWEFFCSWILSFGILTGCASGDTSHKDSLDFPIDSVIIVNKNIFETDSAEYNYWPFRLANKLHIRTRKFVIERELLLKRGDFFSRSLADETERNLRALPFLWSAEVELYQDANGRNIMKVTTSDTWTLLVGPSINHSASETTFRLRFEEQNLFGLGQFLSFRYFFRNFDDNYHVVSFRENRLLNSRYFLEIYHSTDPEAGLKGIIFGRPLYSLDTKVSFRSSFFDENRRDDYYSHGKVTSRVRVTGDQANFEGYYRFGTYTSKIMTGISLKYRNMNVVDSARFSPAGENTNTSIDSGRFRFPVDSLYYEIEPEFSIQNLNYAKAFRINSYGRVEDIRMINGCLISLGWADDINSRRDLYRTVTLQCNFSKYYNSNLVYVGLYRKFWYSGGIDFRKTLSISIKYYNNALTWLTPVIRMSYDEDYRWDKSAVLYLGENNGLRGYPKNFSTGSRRLYGNVENRLFSGIQVFSVDIGAAQFSDFGCCWIQGTDIKTRDILWSVGGGLRLGIEKISATGIFRLDFAYAGQLKTWQISFGLGQYFE